MFIRIGEAANAASPKVDGAVCITPRRRISPRMALAFSLAAAAIAGTSFVLNSGTYQDWRLSNMDLPALRGELHERGENPRLLYYIGASLDRESRFGEADGYLRQAVGLDPDAPRLREEWARALLGSGQTTAAFGELREFAGTHPQVAEAHFILGKFYYTQRSMKRAAEEFEQAVALNPGNAQAFLQLAGVRSDLRENEQAWKAAVRASALAPNSADAHLILASLSMRAGQPMERARSEFERAIRLAPRNAAAHEEYAHWLLEHAPAPAGMKLAEEHARKAIDLGIGDGATFLILGRARTYMRDNAGAVDPLLHAADLMPNDPAPALALVQTHRALGNRQEAAAWQREYVRRQTAMTEQQRLLQNVTIAPNDPKAKERLARWMGRHGDSDGCAHNYSMAMQKPLDSPAVLIAASRDLIQGGYPQLALPLARGAANAAGRNPDAHEALGDALLHTLQITAATDEYNISIRLEPSRADRLIGKLRDFVAARRRDPEFRTVHVQTFNGTASPASERQALPANSNSAPAR